MIDSSVLPGGDMFINGEVVRGGSLGAMAHFNPTTGLEQGQIALAGQAEVDAAVRAAREALPAWRRMPGDQRAALMFRLADLLMEHQAEMASIGVLENGAPITVTRRGCSVLPAEWLRYYAGWIDKIEGRTIPAVPGTFNYTMHQPYGVVALLLAFNGPMGFIGFKLAPALAAGNTVVIKPSELAPWAVIRFAQLVREAGFPPGVINIVTGDGRAGQMLAGHPGVDKISFTGGASTARRLLATAAENLTPVTTELGGKSAAIVFEDANLDRAVASAVLPTLSLMSGQICLAGTRLLVQESVYADVLQRAVNLARGVKIGDPALDTTQMGPVINEANCQRILGVIQDATNRGDGRLVSGGNRPGGDLARGSFVEPTVFGDVNPDSKLAQEEIFGPVLSVIPFKDEADAVRIANCTQYGLAGYVFTENFGKAHRVVEALDAGFVSINHFGRLQPSLPFGGFKQSGSGREGGYEGLLEMMQLKNVQSLVS